MRGLWLHPTTGKPYFRTRRGGKVQLVPLPDDLAHDHPDFLAAWAAAAKCKGVVEKPKAGTLASTWAAALAAPEAATWSAGYRAIIAREARLICAKAGHVAVRGIRPDHVRADLRNAPNPGARRKAWRFWGGVCLDRGWIAADPTQGLRPPPRKAKAEIGHPAWTDGDVAAFRARWPIGTVPRAAMELLHWTGARISDAVWVGPQHVDKAGVLVFRQVKTVHIAYVPWTAALPTFAAAGADDRALMHQALAPMAGQMTFLATAGGRTRSAKALGTLLATAARAAEVEKSAHGLRKRRTILLAEGGATPHQIGAWTGHQSLSEVTHYTRESNRRAAVIGTLAEPERETQPDPVETRAS